ncbi:unnamed protein product [Merluccius merluccius]
MWVEINGRVNYPLKTALVQMTDQEELDMEDNLTKFCVSTLSLQVARIGMQNVVESWNAHRIPGKGIPNDLCGQGCPSKVAEHLLPLGNVAADLYEQEVGGGATLRRESPFATDPFPSWSGQIGQVADGLGHSLQAFSSRLQVIHLLNQNG